MGLEVGPVFKNALGELFEVGVVYIWLEFAELVHPKPTALLDHVEDPRELLLLLRKIDQKPHQQLLDFVAWDF